MNLISLSVLFLLCCVSTASASEDEEWAIQQVIQIKDRLAYELSYPPIQLDDKPVECPDRLKQCQETLIVVWVRFMNEQLRCETEKIKQFAMAPKISVFEFVILVSLFIAALIGAYVEHRRVKKFNADLLKALQAVYSTPLVSDSKLKRSHSF